MLGRPSAPDDHAGRAAAPAEVTAAPAAAPSRLTLKSRVRLALFAVLIPLLIVGSVSALLLRSSARDSRAAQQRASALAQIAALQNVLTGSGTPMTSVLRTGSTTVLDRFLADHAGTQAEFDALAQAVPAAARGPVEEAGRGWTAIVTDLRTLHREAENGTASSAIPLLVRLADEVIAPEHDLELASDLVAKDLHAALARTHAHQQEQQRLLLVLALVGVLLVAVLSRYLNRSIGAPLVALRQAADRLRYGRLDDGAVGTVPLPRAPELAAVASAFNGMTRRLADGSRLLAESEARHRALITHSSDLVVVVTPDTTITSATPSAERLLGLAPSDLVGRRLVDLVAPDDIPVLLRSLQHQTADTPAEFTLRHADGRAVEIEAHVVDLLVEPAVQGIVLTLRDVSERRELERRLSHQAFHDNLTGLPNRALLRDRLVQALRRRSAERPVAVLFLDLNDFKTVNDSLGHSAGDELLQLVAARLALQLRSGDTALRLGGDEFVVLLEDTGEVDALALAERLRLALGQPAEFAGVEVFPQAAIGVAVSGPSTTADELLAHADTAMYAAKTANAGGVSLYRPELGCDVLQRLELKSELQRGLDRAEFEVHYQPSVELDSGRIRGVEALVRWRRPERGLVPPLEFIPLAEETGFILEIGAFVLREACAQLASWQRSCPDVAPASVSVNVSGRQLFDPHFVGQVREVLDSTGLPAGNLVLEITETVLVGDDPVLLERLHELRALGVRLAIDDFGTGYSSLAYLQRMPFDILKIDKSFVDALADPAQQGSLVATIVALARDLRLDTVAEGIEAPTQAQSLIDLGCRLGQGYLFARPTTASELSARLAGAAAV